VPEPTVGATEVTLGSEARELFRYASPRLIAVALVIAVVSRVRLGEWSVADLVVAAAILGAQPFTEWLIHVFVLHAKPRTVLGRRIDPLAAREHRAHHADPRDRALVLVPLPIVAVGLPLAAVLVVLAADPLAQGVTGLVVGYGMLLTYEWTHHLIHSSYRPRHSYYRSIWRSHRLHHYRNEQYWFGVTINLADHVLRTFPARDAVPLSPTARTLGVSPVPGWTAPL
jgi:sterol desaturase/sphingolipid hydroxylase (fatty acid hydroxylase superfamily)